MSIGLVGVAAAIVMAGCSTTVPGTGVGDPSAQPRPDAGSFPTTPRTLAPLTDSQAATLEGYRMVEAIPLPTEVNAAVRYRGSIKAGRLASKTVGSSFGNGIGTAVTDMEVGAYVAASDVKSGGDYSKQKQLLLGVFRMKDAAAATAAVANPAVMASEESAFGATPAKQPVGVDGYADAKAYSQKWDSTNSTNTVGLLARGQYVLAVWSSIGGDSVKKFFDLQTKALDAFKPTPVNQFSTLKQDTDGLLTYTVGAKSSGNNATVPARVALVNQDDITAAQKDFADAGVDYVARADNKIYRAKDDAGATLLQSRFIDEIKAVSSSSTETSVTGAPGSRCLATKQSESDKTASTYCVLAVGRYLAEFSGSQETEVKQMVGASYLTLKDAK